MHGCEHTAVLPGSAPEPLTASCRRCAETGQRPVALRRCLVCGNVACCDSTPGQHAAEHFRETGHPVMVSFEPGETWRWCYLDKSLV
jgi:uncharacterized UBP type Zn finger protein